MPRTDPSNENARALKKYPIGRRIRYAGEAAGHVVGHKFVGELLEIVFLGDRSPKLGQFGARSPKFVPAPGPLVDVPEKDRILPPAIRRRELLSKLRDLSAEMDDDLLERLIKFVEASKMSRAAGFAAFEAAK